MMGAGSIGCLGYGLSVIGFAGCVLVGFFLFQRKFKQKAEGLENRPNRVRLTREDRPFVFRFLTLWLCGLVLFFIGAFVEVRGVEAGWFEGQTECPHIWPTPRSLRDLG
jgi:hypothetical protein